MSTPTPDTGTAVAPEHVPLAELGAGVNSGAEVPLSLLMDLTLPLSIEGAYSVDNHSYETWFIGLSASARW